MSRPAGAMNIDEDLARIALQEEKLRFSRFDASVAWELGLALKAAADARGVRVALDISTPSYTLFSHAMDGATPDNSEWVRRKRNVTLPSELLRDRARAETERTYAAREGGAEGRRL